MSPTAIACPIQPRQEPTSPELITIMRLRLTWLSYLALLMLIARLLNESGHESVQLLDRLHLKGRRKISGIDLVSVIRTDYGRQKVAVQVKRYLSTTISRAQVDTFRGAMIRENIAQGILITTSTFAPKAYLAAAQHPTHPIFLVDGERLASWLIDLKLGVEDVRSLGMGPMQLKLDVEAFERLEIFAKRYASNQKGGK